MDWPSLSSVWIRLRGIPYHCWSSNILFSIASSVGLPLKLDDITAGQKILTFARILVNLDLSKPRPQSILVDLEGEFEITVSISYENVPCSACFSSSHPDESCKTLQIIAPMPKVS